MNPLPAVATSPVSAPNAFHATLRDSERALILQALKEVGWVNWSSRQAGSEDASVSKPQDGVRDR